MAKAKSKSKGRKSSQKTASVAPKTTSVAANTNSEAVVLVTPPRKKGPKGNKKKHQFSLLPASKTKKPEGNAFESSIVVRSMGPGGLFLCAITEQPNTKRGGFMSYCYDELKEDDECQLKVVFDCRLSDRQVIRVSHESNAALEQVSESNFTNKKWGDTKWYWCGLIGSPARKPMEEDEERERKFRDEIERVMVARRKPNQRPTKYQKWDYKKHSRTKEGYESLDKLFVDDVVADVIRTYVLSEEMELKDTYDFLKSRGLNNFFSRKKDGRYCSVAINEFNFPADAGEQSDYGEESEDETEENNDDGNAITGEEDNVEEGVE